MPLSNSSCSSIPITRSGLCRSIRSTTASTAPSWFARSLMKQAGYGGAFLHSRIGLLTPYLGEEWFRMMQIGTQALQALDMDVWYYDEDKWPSGFAGGIVPRQKPDFRARCLIRLPLGTPVEAPDSVLLRDDHYLYVCRVNPMGQPRYNGTCWVDLMNPGTVRAFIESSYTPYVERFGGHPRVRGMFTDEPNVIVRPEMAHQGAVSYSPVLDSLFRARCGYELQPVIPALFDTVGEWRRIRLDYYRTVAYALEQAFSKPIGDYCAGNGWIWTGHYNGEDTPGLTMANTGNLMQQLRHMQQPGLDALALRLNTIYSAKGVTSVANQYGRQRRLCELFGIGGHNLSFEDRMWITSWNTIMGINFMCPHLYQYSLKGERKRDYPPAISHQQPYWPYNGLFEDFLRPALLFRDGRSERARYMRDPSAGVGLPGDPDQPDYTHRRAGAGIGRVDAFAPEFRFRRRTDYLRDGSYRCGSLRDRGDGLPRGGASGTDDDPPQHAR